MAGIADDATSTESRIRAGELTAAAAVARQLERLHAVEQVIGGVAAFEDDLAIREAERLDRIQEEARGETVGALHGVPVTIKDWIDAVGFPCAGTGEGAERRPARDATVVARLRAAGAVVVAKTTAWTSPSGRGVHHPVDTAMSVGGSSSGEAALLGADASLLGIGSDSGGSIRLPAAWCGVYGLRPTYGRVPSTGHFPRVGPMGDGRTVIGPLARSIDDLELVLAVIAGADGLDGAAPPVPPPPLPSPRIDVGNGVRGRRAAVVTAGLEGGRVLPTIKKAVERAGAALEAAGMELVEWPWPAWLAEALDVTERYWRRSQGQLDAADADRHLIDWDRFRARYLRVMADVDIVVLPTVAETAPAEREITGEDFVFDLPAALAGAPALSVPAGWDGQGLPLAVQLSGRPWEDALVLAAGRVVADPG